MKFNLTLLLSSFLLFSCAPAIQIFETEVINVYATSAAQPWLTKLYVCAADSTVVLNIRADAPDIYLRVGEPDIFVSPVYKIDEEEILVVTHRESPVQILTLEETQVLFAQGSASAQVWVYSSDADVQMAFDQLVMKGRSVTSSAKVAVNSQQMSDLLNAEKDTVGILPRHWKAVNQREVFSAGVVPVFAITKQEPQGVVVDLISCLRRN